MLGEDYTQLGINGCNFHWLDVVAAFRFVVLWWVGRISVVFGFRGGRGRAGKVFYAGVCQFFGVSLFFLLLIRWRSVALTIAFVVVGHRIVFEIYLAIGPIGGGEPGADRGADTGWCATLRK